MEIEIQAKTMSRAKTKLMFEQMKQTKIKFENQLAKLLTYIEEKRGTDDFYCVDAQSSPQLYTFEQFCKKQGIEEMEFK